jgi:nitrogen fixation/metabolism regulation signal transduction histidine kinase
MESWLENFARANFRRSADTAHDLKTPLNVAILNLELLRMRAAKAAKGRDDQKLAAYARAIETELRRMAQIFDAFFLLSTPPKDEGDPTSMDLAPLCREAATASGYAVQVAGPVLARGHASRIRQVFKLFFEGAQRVLKPGAETAAEQSDGVFHVTITGHPEADDLELTKVFKFYYTDPLGNPDLSLAAARLIVETYGGELNGVQERDKVSLRLSFPLGDR